MARILYVCNWSTYFRSHRLVLAQAARDAGYDVHIAVPEDSDADRLRGDGFPVHPLPMRRRSVNPFEAVRAVRALKALYITLSPDLVHAVPHKTVLYAGLAARLRPVPAFVGAVAGMGYLFTGGLFRRLAGKGLLRLLRTALNQPRRALILQNPEDLDLFVRTRTVSGADTVLIRGAGVDVDHFHPEPEPEGDVVAVLPARMLWNKGVWEFVEAARRLRASGAKARFVLAGGVDRDNRAGIPEATLRGWVAEGVVEWDGHVADMADRWRRAHIACLPSYREGLPKSLLEAMASGRPCVATDVPGCREAVAPGVNGLLVPARDAGALATALAALIDDKAARERMGREGRRRAEAEFAAARILAETLAVYRRLLTEEMPG